MTCSTHASVVVCGFALSARSKDPASPRSAWGRSLDPAQSGDGGGWRLWKGRVAKGDRNTPGGRAGCSGHDLVQVGTLLETRSWYRQVQRQEAVFYFHQNLMPVND